MTRHPRELRIRKRRAVSISRIMAFAFLGIILLGALLLDLPFASRDGNSAGFMTSLFTATSATCVTGLVLADTFTQWSGFGQAGRAGKHYRKRKKNRQQLLHQIFLLVFMKTVFHSIFNLDGFVHCSHLSVSACGGVLC